MSEENTFGKKNHLMSKQTSKKGNNSIMAKQINKKNWPEIERNLIMLNIFTQSEFGST